MAYLIVWGEFSDTYIYIYLYTFMCFSVNDKFYVKILFKGQNIDVVINVIEMIELSSVFMTSYYLLIFYMHACIHISCLIKCNM